MPRFIFVYHGGAVPMAPEEAAAHKERYMEWLGQVGSALVSPANPMGPSKLVGADGVADTPAVDRLTGFSVVEVDDLDEALRVARSCPFLEIGTLEVAQLLEMRPPA